MKRSGLLVLLLVFGGILVLATRLVIDKASLATKTKALTDPDQSIRDAAAADVRAIVARYPSHTPNILELDGGAKRWSSKLSRIAAGAPESDVVTLLLPKSEISRRDSITGIVTTIYRLDYHWTVAVDYLPPTAPGKTPTVLKVGPLRIDEQHMLVAPDPAGHFSGTWRQYYANGALYDETPIFAGTQSGPPVKYDPNGKVISFP